MAVRSEIPESENWHTGTDHLFRVLVYQADRTTRQDLTGLRPLSWLLKRGHGEPDAAALVAKTTAGAGGITVVDDAQGELEILVEADDTRDLAGGRLVHELKIEKDGEESILMYGPAVLKRALHLDPPS